MGARAHIRGPLDPDLRGASPVKSHKISGAQNQEYLPALQSGPTGALRMQKLQPTQFRTCACRLRTNAPILFSAVGAGALTRPPSPVALCLLFRRCGEPPH